MLTRTAHKIKKKTQIPLKNKKYYQREASVHAEHGNIDRAGVVGNTEAVRFRHVLHIVKRGDTRQTSC